MRRTLRTTPSRAPPGTPRPTPRGCSSTAGRETTRSTAIGDATARNTVGYGNDLIRARDGLADSVDCGVGADTAVVDAADVVAASCESVDRSAAEPPKTN